MRTSVSSGTPGRKQSVIAITITCILLAILAVACSSPTPSDTTPGPNLVITSPTPIPISTVTQSSTATVVALPTISTPSPTSLLTNTSTLTPFPSTEELTLEEYFQLIIEINSESNEKADALTGPVGVDATSSEEANIKALQVFLQELLAVISGSNERIKSVNPPREVRNEHEELVRTSRLFRNSLRIS